MKIFQGKLKVRGKEFIGKDYFKLAFESGFMAGCARPGQFVEIKVSDSNEPLLRRPLGIHRVRGRNFEVLCEIVGKGTQALSQAKAGECLDVIGPLGNGFDLAPYALRRTQCILVAGGMGVAPLLFLSEKLKLQSCKSAKPLVLLGAKTNSHILCTKEFKASGCAVEIATDDGSRGFKGRVTDLLRKVLRENETTGKRDNGLAIYSCGPEPMLKEISAISNDYNIPARISLEAHMACGIGACLGCVVKTTDGFKRVCKEGPVFDAREIVWQNEKE